MLLTDDRLVEAMRSFVTASNRLEHLLGRGDPEITLVEQLTEERRVAAVTLQEALTERGWRRPVY